MDQAIDLDSPEMVRLCDFRDWLIARFNDHPYWLPGELFAAADQAGFDAAFWWSSGIADRLGIRRESRAIPWDPARKTLWLTTAPPKEKAETETPTPDERTTPCP